MPLMAMISPAIKRSMVSVNGIGSDGIVSVPSGRNQPDVRPADRAGVGLRVEAAIGWVVVLRLAGRAHRESRHRGLRPVVGNAARDGEARTAVGAVQKWIAVAAIVGIEQFAQAVRAGRRVRGNARAHLAATSLATMRNSFSLVSEEALRTPPNRCATAAELRRFRRAQKRFHSLGRPFNLDGHAAGIVADEAREALFRRQPVDEWPEPNALHHAAHGDRLAPQHFVPF